MLTVFCSAGRSPGVSTAATATALAWPREVILAECDPAGGTALTGLCMRLLPRQGLTQWALATGRGADPDDELEHQLANLDGPGRRLLALPPGPAVPAVRSCWDRLATTLTSTTEDVIADTGRIGGSDTPIPLLATAGTVLVVARPLYPDLAAAHAVLRYLAAIRGPAQTAGTQVLLAGPGPYPQDVIERDLGSPVIARFPRDPRSATLLTSGVRPSRPSRPLQRAARSLAAALVGETGGEDDLGAAA
jgi:hypothetical protein